MTNIIAIYDSNLLTQLDVRALTLPGTKEYYFAAVGQFTVLDRNYDHVLNDIGKEMLNKVKEQVEKGEFKDELLEARFEMSRSGMWMVDKDREGHDKYGKDCEEVGSLCTWRNQVLLGKRKDGMYVTTSVVRFKGDDWVSTLSGSVYKIVEWEK